MIDENIISRIKAWVFIPEEPPKDYIEHWKESMKDAGSRMGENLKKSISGLGDYAQKMAKQNIQNEIEFLNPNYRTRSGRTYENIINRMITNIPKGYAKFKDKTERLFETVEGEAAKRFAEKIESEAYQATLKTSRQVFPFTGYKNIIRGIAPFAARWLTGDKTVAGLLRRNDRDLEGGPVLITLPEKAGEFRKALINRIKQAGARIVKYKFAPFIISDENARTNQLVSEYTIDGLAVRVEFSTENTRLYLEIEVSRE